MASDISLAVGDGARRMTYAELADIRRISVASAMRLVRRKNWPRQTGNDGVVRILVPLPAAHDRQQRKDLFRGETSTDKQVVRRGHPRTSDRTSAPDNWRTIEALENAIAALREQLAKADQREESAHRRAERERAEQSERRADELQAALMEESRQVEAGRKRIDELQQRVDQLHTDLADAVTAERIAAGEAAALRAIVTGLRARPWWRRWFRG